MLPCQVTTKKKNGYVTIAEAFTLLHPIGSLLFIDNAEFDPNVEFEGTTWEKIAQDRCIQSSSDIHPTGTILDAGLPNLTGFFRLRPSSEGNSPVMDTKLFGFVSDSDTMNRTYVEPAIKIPAIRITFDASHFNSIYGNSTTVQPPALCVNIWKRIA